MARAGPSYHRGVEAETCPLQQLQKTQGGWGVLLYLPREKGATLPASKDVTAVTDSLDGLFVFARNSTWRR
jgi:hypothetical protein